MSSKPSPHAFGRFVSLKGVRRGLLRHLPRLTLFISLVLLLLSSARPLATREIPQVIQKILDYHVEYKKMTPELLQRSLSVYLDYFDPTRDYLLENEAATYKAMSEERVQEVFEEYRRGDLSVYEEINALTQTAILRARGWRDEFRQDPALLSIDSASPPAGRSYERPAYAKTESELKERVRLQMARYLQWQKKEAPFPYTRLKKALDLFERKMNAHENTYLFVGEQGKALLDSDKENALSLRVLKAMTASLDAHSTFFTPSEAYYLKVQLEKELYGVGVVLQESLDGVVIARLIPGGPAETSGLIKPNDILIEVDGKTLDNLSFENALNLMRGKEHSVVALGLVRYEMVNGKPVEKKFQVQLQRRKIVMEEDRIKVSYEPYQDGIIGKITLYSFYEGDGGRSSERDLKDALEKLYKQGDLKGLVLDLRANTGGFLSQAIKVAGLFITNGVVAVSKYSDGSLHYYRDLDGYIYYDGPMTILTSKGSASAAEIVAQSLQDYGVALIVGDKRTYGKGTIQYQTVTDDKSPSFFKVTVGRYYSVSGKSIQMRGVQADVVVPTQLYATKIGEKYLEYPLTPDTVASAFEDPLSDVDVMAYPWFLQYYLPSVQKKSEQWQPHLSYLRQQSADRLAKNPEYRAFLAKYAKGLTKEGSQSREDKEDLVMQEAVNVIKDMIHVSSSSSQKATKVHSQ